MEHKDLLCAIVENFNLENLDVYQTNPLVLAYVGDAVYEVFIRTMIVSDGKASVNAMHKKSIAYVKAKAQSDILNKIVDNLTEEEVYFVKRGRNAKSGTAPKNANISEYRRATGFECLIGYLFLTRKNERLMEILNESLENYTLEKMQNKISE